MADKILFELVSPEKILVSEMVEMVVIPGTEGNFGVLKGHSPLISTIRPGMIEIYENDVVTTRLFVAGGFAEVVQERCTVLADEALALETLDRHGIEVEMHQLADQIDALRTAAGSGGEAERAAFEAADTKLAIARAKLDSLSLAGLSIPHPTGHA
ncbi:MAG TPA: ATP synthase F1 subunit epsilon [Stellaceae bacterium]|jgi:F-type H+-transporting ATPase subunit epsilon|nr:ATP synthase F1 subunit epsilon [Stellaceae bacterium]